MQDNNPSEDFLLEWYQTHKDGWLSQYAPFDWEKISYEHKVNIYLGEEKRRFHPNGTEKPYKKYEKNNKPLICKLLMEKGFIIHDIWLNGGVCKLNFSYKKIEKQIDKFNYTDDLEASIEEFIKKVETTTYISHEIEDIGKLHYNNVEPSFADIETQKHIEAFNFEGETLIKTICNINNCTKEELICKQMT